MKPTVLLVCIAVLLNAIQILARTHPKCCDPEDVLNADLKCQQISSASVPTDRPRNCDTCVDFMIINNKWQLITLNCVDGRLIAARENYIYPKCCPINYSYDTFAHKCVHPSDSIADNSTELKSGITNCPIDLHAIVDYKNTRILISDNGSVEIKGGRTFEYGKYCMDTTEYEENIVRVCDSYANACVESYGDDGVVCLKKCCPDGFAYYRLLKGCSYDPVHGLNVNITRNRLTKLTDVDFAILSIPQQKKYLAQQKHHFYIDKYGNMHVREGIEKRRRVYTAKSAHYCIETIVAGNSTRQEFFLLFKNQSKMTQYKFITTATCLLISCFFLLLTFIGYLVIPDMLNLFGKTVVCYTFITFCGFSVLAWVQINNDMPHNWCTTFGFLIQFSFLASFAWLNVICYDMWTVFGTFSTRAFGKSHEWRRFFFYNLYAWTVPTVFTALVLWAFFSENTPAAIKPHIGKEKCFYNGESDYAHIVFFSIPVALCILANSVMFMKTIMYYTKVKNEIEKMKDQTGKDAMKRRSFFQTDTDRMITLLKLFVIMGLFWLFEVISNFISFKENIVMEIIEFIMDTFTSLQGLFIFCIFMVKKKVAAKLLRKFRRYEVRSVRSSSSTRTTALLSQDARLTFDMRQSTSTKQ